MFRLGHRRRFVPATDREAMTAPALGPVVVWLSLAAMAIILAGIAGHVLKVREAAYLAAREQARVSTELLSENAGRLLDSADFLVDSARERVEGRPWRSIASDRQLWQTLRGNAARFPHIDAVWLNDTDGDLRLVTHAFPSPASNVLDRDFFTYFVEGGEGAYISKPILGRITNEPTFLLTRQLSLPDGSMRGIVSVTMDTAFFADFLETFKLPYNASMALVRHAGDVLVAAPADTGDSAAAEVQAVVAQGAFARAIETESVVGWMKRLSTWPLYAVVRFDRAAIDTAWREAVTPYVVIGGLALLSLFGLAAFAHAGERARRES